MLKAVDEGEGDGEGGAGGGSVERDGAPVHTDDLAGQTESYSGASTLCGEEGKEDTVGGIGTYAATIV